MAQRTRVTYKNILDNFWGQCLVMVGPLHIRIWYTDV